MVSKVPAHEIGQACLNALRRYGVNTDYIVRGGDRLGLLYMETGASQRPTKVIYDRAASSIRQIGPTSSIGMRIFAGKDWFHFSGTPRPWATEVVEALTAGLAPPGNWG